MIKVIDSYPYLKHLIELWAGYWEELLGNINEFVREKNQHQQESEKAQAFRTFSRN